MVLVLLACAHGAVLQVSMQEIFLAEVLLAKLTLGIFLYFRALVFCADIVCGGLFHALQMVKEDFTIV